MAQAHCRLPPCQLPLLRTAPVELALVALPSARSGHDDLHALAGAGPGWFESSWDLRRGLDVREGLPGDANLSEWLAICLGRDGAAPYRPAARATSRATASPRSITAIA